MLQVLRQLIQGDGHKPVFGSITTSVSSNTAPFESSEKAIVELLEKVFPADARVLFHLDEHRKASRDAAVRRGAFTALAGWKRGKCVATYVEPPLEIPAFGSPGLCRNPLPLPLVDLRKVFETYPEMDIRNFGYG